jgi:diadenosine tetraphosphatase ApaH/serine/threonine PP2A family protein phosphatase
MHAVSPGRLVQFHGVSPHGVGWRFGGNVCGKLLSLLPLFRRANKKRAYENRAGMSGSIFGRAKKREQSAADAPGIVLPDLDAMLLHDVEGGALANQDQISSLLGNILEVVTPAGIVEGDWQLAGAQVDHHGCVKVVKGLQSLQVQARDLLKLNAALLPPLPLQVQMVMGDLLREVTFEELVRLNPDSVPRDCPASAPVQATMAAARDGQTHRVGGRAKEVYLARHPHVAGAPCLGETDFVPSAAADRVVLRKPHVDIGSVKVAASSWRGAQVDKACCAFKLATHFISRFQKVCLDPFVPVASQSFTEWLASNMQLLAGSDNQLRQLMAPFSRPATKHGNHFLAAVECLTEECTRLVKSQPMLVRVSGHTKVYGDIHGQLADLLALFREHGFPSNRCGGDIELCSYIFDGDFVDRGPQQVEVVLLLLSLKVAFPDRVVLVRGNHEFKDMNEDMGDEGFVDACMHHGLFGSYGELALDAIYGVFDWLPFAALVEESVLVVHGGIGDGEWAEHSVCENDIEWLANVECRPVKTLSNHEQSDQSLVPGSHRHRTLMNIVWSDPITDARPSEWQPHYRDNSRGDDIVSFSSKTTQSFCARNHISMILRGHEVAEKGYEMLHSGRLCTVFSVRNYCGSRLNDAALVLLQLDADDHVQIKFKTLQHLDGDGDDDDDDDDDDDEEEDEEDDDDDA